MPTQYRITNPDPKKKRKKLVPVREAPPVPKKKKEAAKAAPKKKRGGIAMTRFNKDGTKSVITKSGKKFRVKQKKD